MSDEKRNKLADGLYEKYGKPLEKNHWGKYVAISPTGKTLVAPTLLEAMRKATATFGRGNFLFKVGTRIVGTALWQANL